MTHEFSFFSLISTFNIVFVGNRALWFFLFTKLSSFHNLSCEFNMLTQINLGFFVLFFNLVFFYFILQHWIGWKMSFIFFLFIFHVVIPISWSGLLVWQINLGWSCFFFVISWFFFLKNYLSMSSWLVIDFHNLF
jgi:hypothetical protein